jgi:AraC-like DNA-binding protein
MADATTLSVLNLALRGGVVLLLLLIGAALLHDRPKAPVARLGALFALGAAAYAVCSTQGFHQHAGLWAAPFIALAVGNNLVFWLFARTLFGDDLRTGPSYLLLWAPIAGAGVVAALGLVPDPAQRAIGLALSAQALAFAGLAVAQTLSSWAADLVEPRRRLRVFIVAASALHIGLTAAAGLAPRLDATPLVRLVDALSLALIALTVAWTALRGATGALLLAAEPHEGLRPATTIARLDPSDTVLLRRLEQEMNEELTWRRDGLTIGQLAHGLGVPEYRLRRVINRGLGHRNFAAYLNSHRIAEAKAALADSTQAEVPILTIALDAGFGSLGPFNRAFKAETGLTPSAFRRACLGTEDMADAAEDEGLALGSAA